MSIQRRDTKKGVRYDVRLRGPDGREVSRTFRTEREARLFETEERSAMQRGGWVDPRSAATPFAAVTAQWIDSNPSKRPSTLARDDVTLRLHILPTLGPRPIGQITPVEVQALVKRWLSERKPSSVARDYRTLAAIFHFAVDRDYLVRSPCRRIRLPKGPHRDVHVVDAAELARLAKAMGDFGSMVYVAAVLGLRWGEVAGLRVGRLNLANRTLEVAEQVTRGRGGRIFLGEPKSDAGHRLLAMPVPLVELLRAHLDARGLTKADQVAFVFPARDGGLPAGPARRRTSPRRPLTGHVPVRFDDATIAAVKERADANGMTVSAWIRRLVDRELAPVDTAPRSGGDTLVVRIPAGTRRVTLELRGPDRRAQAVDG